MTGRSVAAGCTAATEEEEDEKEEDERETCLRFILSLCRLSFFVLLLCDLEVAISAEQQLMKKLS